MHTILSKRIRALLHVHPNQPVASYLDRRVLALALAAADARRDGTDEQWAAALKRLREAVLWLHGCVDDPMLHSIHTALMLLSWGQYHRAQARIEDAERLLHSWADA